MSAARAAAGVLGGLVAVALGGCESTQDKSARLEKQGAKAAVLGTVDVGAKNTDVKLGETTLLRSELGTAVVVELTNTASKGQVAVPIQLDVEDAKGATVYKNDIDGLQPALQQLALLEGSRPAYWVNDQVTAATPAKKVAVEVGRAEGPAPARLPDIRLSGVKLEKDGSDTLATGMVRNFSKLRQVNMPIYAVVKRGGKVVAAGRALIEKLAPEPQKQPTIFSIFFIGDPAGGKLDVRPVPTVLLKGT